MEIKDLVIKDVVSVFTVNYYPKTVLSRLNRQYTGLCVKLSGRSVYTQEGRDYVSDSSRLIMLPRGASYSCLVEETGKCIIMDVITENDLPTIQSLTVADKSAAKNLAFSTQYAWNAKRSGYKAYCLSCLYQLLYQAALGESRSYITNVHQARIEKSINYLNEHYHEHTLNLETVAAQSDVSVIYFRKLFREIFGIPPKQHILLMRINYAKELLSLDECNVAQVADAVGFGDIYSFCKAFRKEVGCTPTEYRKGICTP